MKKIYFLLIYLMMIFPATAQDLVLELKFPQIKQKAAVAPKPISAPVVVSGNIGLDITPYPQKYEAGRYSVEYYLDSDLLIELKGDESSVAAPYFKYQFDTKKFPNGVHKAVVNFWDKNGKPAIATLDLEINN
jgi:hypothetical protein